MENETMGLDLNLPPSRPNERMFLFPSAYGGVIQSNSAPQIHDLMGKLRKEIGAVEAKKSQEQFGPKFPVRGAKDLNQKLANALNALNMVATVVKQDVNIIPTETIPKNETKNGNPVFRTLAHVKSTVRIIAPDTSFIDCVGSGHGGDVDDKSGGKASTYAWKDAILKGLSIPHEDMVDTDDDSSTSDGESPAVRGAGRKATQGGSTGGGNGAKAEGARGEAGAGRGGSASTGQGGSGVESSEPSDSAKHLSEANGTGLPAVLAAIEKADTKLALDAIRDDIKSGKYSLHGADRLKATQAWVMADSDLKKGN